MTEPEDERNQDSQSEYADEPVGERDERDRERIGSRAELLPEERTAGSDDPEAEAEAILAESDERTDAPEESRLDSTQTPDPGA